MYIVRLYQLIIQPLSYLNSVLPSPLVRVCTSVSFSEQCAMLPGPWNRWVRAVATKQHHAVATAPPKSIMQLPQCGWMAWVTDRRRCWGRGVRERTPHPLCIIAVLRPK